MTVFVVGERRRWIDHPVALVVALLALLAAGLMAVITPGPEVVAPCPALEASTVAPSTVHPRCD